MEWNPRVYDYVCPTCNAQAGQTCQAITHRGKWHGVRPHLRRLVEADFEELEPFPFCEILNPDIGDRK